MKKTFALMTVVLVAAVAFTSCTKEGQYNPKKKISEIVFNSSYVETISGITITDTRKEVWTWNGDLLSFIDYYNSRGERLYTESFRYDDKNRIAEIHNSDQKLVFDYDDNLIDEITYYDSHNSIVEKIEFEHKGGKITSIMVEGSDDYGQKSFNPLRYFLPEDVAETVMKSASKGVTHYTLTWTGKNITKMEASGQTNATWEFTYDDKVNPFKSLFDLFNSGYAMMLSSNNVTRSVYTTDNERSTVDYTYVYDGKYPVKKQYQTVYSGYFSNYPVNCVYEYKY